MRRAIAAAALIALAAPAAARPAGEDRVVATLLACAPQTFVAALDCLDQGLAPENKAELTASDEAGGIRHGLGGLIRLAWVRQGPLADALKALGITDYEARANFIIDGYTARLRGQPFDLAAQAAAYRNGGHGLHSGDHQ